jgi:hypothetical protein
MVQITWQNEEIISSTIRRSCGRIYVNEHGAIFTPVSAEDEEPESRRSVHLAIWCTIMSAERSASVTKVSRMSGVSR